MNNQEIFDHVVHHLFKQGGPAIGVEGSYPGCAYRGANGTSCAVGCLIKDEFYHPSFEGAGADDITVVQAVQKSLGRILDYKDVNLLCDLQSAHDGQSSWVGEKFHVETLVTWLRGVAVVHNLDDSVLDEVTR